MGKKDSNFERGGRRGYEEPMPGKKKYKVGQRDGHVRGGGFDLREVLNERSAKGPFEIKVLDLDTGVQVAGLAPISIPFGRVIDTSTAFSSFAYERMSNPLVQVMSWAGLAQGFGGVVESGRLMSFVIEKTGRPDDQHDATGLFPGGHPIRAKVPLTLIYAHSNSPIRWRCCQKKARQVDYLLRDRLRSELETAKERQEQMKPALYHGLKDLEAAFRRPGQKFWEGGKLLLATSPGRWNLKDNLPASNLHFAPAALQAPTREQMQAVGSKVYRDAQKEDPDVYSHGLLALLYGDSEGDKTGSMEFLMGAAAVGGRRVEEEDNERVQVVAVRGCGDNAVKRLTWDNNKITLSDSNKDLQNDVEAAYQKLLLQQKDLEQQNDQKKKEEKARLKAAANVFSFK